MSDVNTSVDGDNVNNSHDKTSSTKVTVTSVDIAIEPLTLPLTHAKCVKLRNQYYRLDANSQSIDRNKLIKDVQTNIGVEFRTKGIWNPSENEGHWKDWDDEKFFQKLLLCFPVDDQATSDDPVDQMLELLRKYSIPNLADLPEEGRRAFNNRLLEHITSAFGGEDSETYKAISAEYQSAFIKQALQSLVEVNRAEPHCITAKRVRADLERNRPTDIIDYTVRLGQVLNDLLAAKRKLRDYGISDGGTPRIQHDLEDDLHRTEEPNKSPRTDIQRSPASPCEGCGRTHGGECTYKDHPNYNKSSDAWADTPQGIAFAAKGYMSLPRWSKLDKTNDVVRLEHNDE